MNWIQQREKSTLKNEFQIELFTKLGKRHRIPRTIALVLAATFLSACAAGIGPGANLTSAERMMWSTYAIATPRGMATCVIINRKDRSAPHGIVPVIITSAHALSVSPQGPFYLVIRSPRIGSSPQIGILEFQAPDPADRPFVQHPRHDVAALELQIPAEFASEISLPSFIDENSIARPSDEPHTGDEISVLGFPRVFPGTEGAFPVLRGGKVASYSAGPPVDREKFLLNTNVYGGDSGGPVFSGRRRGRPKLVGIVTERIGKKGAEIPLAVAVNATVIRETLRLQAAREQWYLDRGSSVPSSSGSQAHSRGVQLVGPPKSFRDVLNPKRRSASPIPTIPRN
jgi:hypothetical protein